MLSCCEKKVFKAVFPLNLPLIKENVKQILISLDIYYGLMFICDNSIYYALSIVKEKYMAGIKRNKSEPRFPVKRDRTFVIVCVAAFCFVFLIISFFPMTGKIEDETYIKKLEERIAALENRLEESHSTSDRLKQLSLQSSKMESFINNYNRLDATVSLKTNLLAARLDKMQLQIDRMKNGKAPKKIVAKKLKKEIKAKKKVDQRRFHFVKKGETFYSISRLYGISLNKIRELNGFSEKTVIYPGQKIIVK